MPYPKYTKWKAKKSYIRSTGEVSAHVQRYHYSLKLPKQVIEKALVNADLTPEDHKVIQQNSRGLSEYAENMERYHYLSTLPPEEKREFEKYYRQNTKKKIGELAFKYDNKQEFIDTILRPKYTDTQGRKHFFLGSQEYVIVKKRGKYYTYLVNQNGVEIPAHVTTKGFGFTTEERAWQNTLKREGIDPEGLWQEVHYRAKKRPRRKKYTEYEQISRFDRHPKGRYRVRRIENTKKGTIMMYPEKPFTREIRKYLDKMGWKRNEGGYYEIKAKYMPYGSWEYNWFDSQVVRIKKGKPIPFYNKEERLKLAKSKNPVKVPKAKVRLPKYEVKHIRSRKKKMKGYRFYYYPTKRSKIPKRMKAPLVEKGLDTGDWSGYYKVVRVRGSTFQKEKNDAMTGKGEIIHIRSK